MRNGGVWTLNSDPELVKAGPRYHVKKTKRTFRKFCRTDIMMGLFKGEQIILQDRAKH